MPLTLAPSGVDMSTISLHFPDEPFGITPKRLVWTANEKDKSPSTRPSLHSLVM